jgi:hypothetical protein
MKKLISLVLLVAAGYLVYQLVIKKDEVLEIRADKVVKTSHSFDTDAPAMIPEKEAWIQGTVKNNSKNVVTNIVLNYKLNAQPVEARIDVLQPGETKEFITPTVTLRQSEVTFFLDKTSYE